MTQPPGRPIVVLGAGGHGRETVELIRAAEERDPGAWQLLGVVADDEPDHAMLSRLDVRWLGTVDALKDLGCFVSVAVGNGPLRRRLHGRVRDLGLCLQTVVHPSAVLGHDVSWGPGCYVGALTAATTNVRLGEGVQVNIGCTLSHDIQLADFVTLAPGVNLAGGVVVQEMATIYTGATVLPRITIGRGATVGAGSVVIRDVAPGLTVAGVPARPLR